MKMKCLAYGVVKDPRVKEFYPYPDDGIVDDRPNGPLWVIHCQGHPEWRAVVVCHHCLHKLEPDLWISSNCWASLNPITPFEELPMIRKGSDGKDPYDIELYAEDAPGDAATA
jgi:hypothetical protein